jgi:hypothetical protein
MTAGSRVKSNPVREAVRGFIWAMFPHHMPHRRTNQTFTTCVSDA